VRYGFVIDQRRWLGCRAILLKIETGIGYFVDRVRVTESIRCGIVSCSDHLGRWRLSENGERWLTSVVELERRAPGKWLMRHLQGVRPFQSHDPDSGAGVVGRGGRASEPYVSRAAGPDQRAGLLAPEGDRKQGGSRRSVLVTCSSIRTSRSRCTGSGWRRPGRRQDQTGCAGRSGFRAPSSPTLRHIDSTDRRVCAAGVRDAHRFSFHSSVRK
jgi:hypothetical protein